MHKYTRQGILEGLETQRWHADQAGREVAALNGELGPEAQLRAMAALYAELKASGKNDEAAALKARARAVRSC